MENMLTAKIFSCIKHGGNGLSLLELPTGFGKTYSVIQAIALYQKEVKKKQKSKIKRIIFVTTLTQLAAYGHVTP